MFTTFKQTFVETNKTLDQYLQTNSIEKFTVQNEAEIQQEIQRGENGVIATEEQIKSFDELLEIENEMIQFFC